VRFFLGKWNFNVMKTVYYSLLASSSTIGLLSLGVLSPLHAETLSIGSDRLLNQPIHLADGGLPKEMPKLPESFSPKTVPASPALQQPTFQQPTQSSTPTPPLKELPTKPAIAQPLKPQAPTVEQNPVQSAPTGPAPEALYTPANPLLFPTDSKEVEIKGAVPLTLKQVLELAERNNRDLEVSRLQVEQQKSNLREAQAALFPTLDLQSAVTRSQSANGTISIKSAQADAIAAAGGNEQSARLTDSFSGGQIFSRSVADPSTSWDTSLQLNYNVYNSGGRAARIRAAEGAVKASELSMERVREQLRLDATGDYYDLQNADEQVRINKKAVENAQQSLKDTQLQEKVGLGTRFDVLRSEVQLANNKQALDSAQATQTIQRRQIAQRLSLPEHITVISADEVKRTGTWKKSLEDTIVLAYKQRVELEEQLVQRDISESNRKQALSALGPQISLSASYNLLKIFEQPVSEPVGGYALTATARWRLFDGGSARAQAEQQVINGKIAETRFTQSRNAIRFQVEQAYATMLANDKNIATTDTAVYQASEALRLAKLRFQAGVGTQTDVINAETDLTRAEGNRVTAILGYNRSIAQLRRSVSNVAPE
jgi:outer membrane protein TolC